MLELVHVLTTHTYTDEEDLSTCAHFYLKPCEMNIFLSSFFKTNPAQEVTSSQSLFSPLRLHLVINEENQICIYVHRLYRMCSAVFRPLTLAPVFHINAPHGGADLQRFFWGVCSLPFGHFVQAS